MKTSYFCIKNDGVYVAFLDRTKNVIEEPAFQPCCTCYFRKEC